MSQAIKSAIVRIKTADKIIVGAGFLVTDLHILTCVHVISAALERPVQTMPIDLVHLDFSLVAPKQTTTAQVIFWQPKQSDGTGDIAGLELTNPPPNGVQPAHLIAVRDSWGHPFRAFGFPPHHDDGVWATGVLRDKKANGHIQIEDVKTPGFSVGPGFSGAPVWDDILNGVIGMIVSAERKAERKAAFIIPGDKLIKHLPSDDVAKLRFELASLHDDLTETLRQLVSVETTIPKMANMLWTRTQQLESLSSLLHAVVTKMSSTSPRFINQLQSITQLQEENERVQHILRKILIPSGQNDRQRQKEILITRLNLLIMSVSQAIDNM